MENLDAHKYKVATVGLGIACALLIVAVVLIFLDIMYWQTVHYQTFGFLYMVFLVVCAFFALVTGVLTGLFYNDYLDAKYE